MQATTNRYRMAGRRVEQDLSSFSMDIHILQSGRDADNAIDAMLTQIGIQ